MAWPSVCAPGAELAARCSDIRRQNVPQMSTAKKIVKADAALNGNFMGLPYPGLEAHGCTVDPLNAFP